MNIKGLYLTLLFSAFLTGCAVGNKYNYHQAEVSLPIQGHQEVAIGVVDNRSYVVSGEKTPDFAGLQRGGFGNPFNVTTSSGKPLADDFATSLRRALSKNGYQVSSLHFSSPDAATIVSLINEKGHDKNIILRINEWKSDAMMKLRLLFDLELQVMDRNGNVIARNTIQGDEVIGGAGFEGHNSQSVASAFESKLGRLFNTPEIFSALNH